MSDNRTSIAAAYKRILIVDDEEQVVFVLRNSLKKLGEMYEIVTATNGQDAIDKFENAPFDLLITDLKMPGMNGVVLTEKIRAMDPKTQVIWVTGHDEWQADAQRLGVYRYILKPLDVEDIRQVAREGLEAGQPARPAAERPASQVLIMDDTDDLRRLYSKALGKAGYKVYPAATIHQARQLLGQHHFDVFLCDIRMGSEGLGIDLLREQLDALNRAGTQVIMVSAEARYRDMCEEMGIEFYVEKPVALPPLITLVNRLTASR
jgi:DNA-binding NtrC family response regulator